MRARAMDEYLESSADRRRRRTAKAGAYSRRDKPDPHLLFAVPQPPAGHMRRARVLSMESPESRSCAISPCRFPALLRDCSRRWRFRRLEFDLSRRSPRAPQNLSRVQTTARRSASSWPKQISTLHKGGEAVAVPSTRMAQDLTSIETRVILLTQFQVQETSQWK